MKLLEDLDHAVFGNGRKGLLERVIRVELLLYGLYLMSAAILGMLSKIIFYTA